MTNISRNIIYGVSSKYAFGKWDHVVYGPFESKVQAQDWLHREEYDFRERELMSKTAAVKLAGRKAVENAINPMELQKTQVKESVLGKLDSNRKVASSQPQHSAEEKKHEAAR